jgi:serine protease
VFSAYGPKRTGARQDAAKGLTPAAGLPRRSAITAPRRLPLIGAATALCATLLAAAGAAPESSAAPAGAEPGSAAAEPGSFVPGELLVRFRDQGQEREYELPSGVRVGEAARALDRNPEVRWAVPNYVARASGPGWIPNDRGEKASPPGGWQQLQWNFLPCGSGCDTDAGGASESFGGIDAPGAWENLIEAGRPGAKGVRVAVVDTGVAHRGKGRMFKRSPDLKRGQFKHGRDYVDDDKLALDENGHGTHVASTIAERTDNRKFVTGLAYRATMIPVRVLDEQGVGGSADVARGIRWAYRHGAEVINLSLEFPRSVSSCDKVPSVCAAIDKAHAKGAVVVSASGNAGSLGQPKVDFPAGAPNVIATGATTARGCLADYSHHGEGLDVVAPGGGFDAFDAGPQCRTSAGGAGIVQLTLTRTGTGKFNRFAYPHYEGTSMASAHVAGVAALVWAALSERLGRAPTPEELEARLESTARTEHGLGDRVLYGAGLIDAAAATAP